MSLQTILNQADIFQDLTSDQLERIAQICIEKQFALDPAKNDRHASPWPKLR